MFGETKFMLVGVGVGLVVLAYLKKKAVDIAPKLDPTNPDNLVNQAATSIYQTVTGSEGTIGGDLYDATHGGALDVTSNNNIAASTVNKAGGAITGDTNWTLGGWIYDITH